MKIQPSHDKMSLGIRRLAVMHFGAAKRLRKTSTLSRPKINKDVLAQLQGLSDSRRCCKYHLDTGYAGTANGAAAEEYAS